MGRKTNLKTLLVMAVLLLWFGWASATAEVIDLVTGLSSPSGIALDVAAGKMYWTDLNTGKIQRANMSGGSGVEDLVTGLGGPYGIALDVAAGKM